LAPGSELATTLPSGGAADLSVLPGARKQVLDDNSCLFHAVAVALSPAAAATTYLASSIQQANKPRAAGSVAVPAGVAVLTSLPFL